MQKITPCLWFDDNAEEAVHFYTSIFKNSRITGVSRYGEEGAKISGRPVGSVLTVTFELEGQAFTALNGGPLFKFSPAISFMANCKTQEEIDHLWEKLSAGGRIEQCGWLQDKFGISWQIVPTAVAEMMQDKNPEKSSRTMAALLQMKKIDIAALKQAYEGA
jgi:predicted 3-demethylubiquinone-9 3-methyltransferase (glyoxalase superfamily)